MRCNHNREREEKRRERNRVRSITDNIAQEKDPNTLTNINTKQVQQR